MRTVKFACEDWVIDSWIDFEFLTLEPEITEPEVKTKRVEIDGGDGILDMTEAVSGRVNYRNRSLVYRFRAVGDYCKESRDELIKKIHGQKRFVKFEDEEHYNYGRCQVLTELDKGYYIQFGVTVDAEPYKRDLEPIKIASSVTANGSITLSNNGDCPVVPTIILPRDMQVTVNGTRYPMTSGTKAAPFLLNQGNTTVTFSETGAITIQFWEGYLV